MYVDPRRFDMSWQCKGSAIGSYMFRVSVARKINRKLPPSPRHSRELCS